MNRREKRQLNIGSTASLSTVWAEPIGSAFLFEIEILNLKSIKFNDKVLESIVGENALDYLALDDTLYELDVEVGTPVISYDNLAAYYVDGNIILSGMVDAIEVYDINGALIMNQNVESAFVPAQLENGMYIVKMYNNTTNTISTSKIIVK